MSHYGKSLVLIGMPGAGKSTLGVMLAKEVGLDFVDTDVLIQVQQDRTLQEIIDQSGYLALREIEEETVAVMDAEKKVIATGGSVVYGERAMAHLKEHGTVVFLDVPLDELHNRIHNYEHRGIARRPDQSFDELFQERCDLYNHYADIVIPFRGQSADEAVAEVIDQIGAG